ncbi:MAG: hypothetical protein A2901_01795 [Elusimicrobia bacterium RIFCSPLOWO2_01_FULL_54_10]|nr:MAG: hypothetical protein A2901_01795 [Elusimicrobia bacterium RIFCSPLOWO2_01_FULL_54_10]
MSILKISQEEDIDKSVQAVMVLAENLGFNRTKQCMIGTALSELATNIIRFASKGKIKFKSVHDNDRRGIEIVAEDKGPGIKNLRLAMRDDYSTMKGSLGVGLPGVRRLMDDFKIESKRGTRVTVKKWV